MEIMSLDEIDQKIIRMLKEDPSLTHSAIARRVSRSQPAVGSRIHKLRDRGFLRMTYGVDFEKLQIQVAKVDFYSKDVEGIKQVIQDCPFIVSGIRTSGDRNFTIYVVARDLRTLNAVVDYHFRNRADVQALKMDLATEFFKPPNLSINLQALAFELPKGVESWQETICPFCAAGHADDDVPLQEELEIPLVPVASELQDVAA